MKKLGLIVLFVLFGVLFAGCKENEYEVIKVVATAVPHEEILVEAIPYLNELGYTLEIVVISDYSLGNPAVASSSADANFFQHLPYLNQYNATASNDKKLVNVAGIHIEPIGLYAGSKSSVDALVAGDDIIISDNVSDYGRIVQFLANIGLVETIEGFEPTQSFADTEEAILSKTVDFDFRIIEAALLVQARTNQEGALVFINGNYALEGGLGLSDVLVSEPTENNPYVNVVAVLNGHEDDPKIEALVTVLTSDAIKDFITSRYNGSVIPA